MKTSKFIFVLSVIALLLVSHSYSQSSASSGQDYRNGIGIRFGGLTSGITYKHIGSSGGFEGILSFGYRSFVITGLYEKHNDIDGSPGLRWFYGAGGHVGFFRYGGYYYWHRDAKHFYYVEDDGPSRSIVGIDGIIGLDYKFNNVPIDVSLDLKPFVDFWNGPYGFFDGALSARFTF
jgi:hypothetical protein